MGTELAGKTALVTGAGRNIGRAIALEFAARGANVIINARSNVNEAESVKAEIEAHGVRGLVAIGDVSDPDVVEAMSRRAIDVFGSVDITVSSAMHRKRQSFFETSNDDWHTYLNMQLSASFYLAKAFAPGMVAARWGRIIHITGPDAFRPRPNRVHNVAAKGGIRGLTKALAVELGPLGITVNDVAPGTIDTIVDPTTHPDKNAETLAATAERIPVRRVGTPEDIAWCCAFLADPRSSYITGQVILCDGGQVMAP